MKQPNSSVPRRLTHGYIALGTGGADAEVLHIAQGTHAVGGEGGHGLADGDQLWHKNTPFLICKAQNCSSTLQSIRSI